MGGGVCPSPLSASKGSLVPTRMCSPSSSLGQTCYILGPRLSCPPGNLKGLCQPAILVGTHWTQPGQKHSANAQGTTCIHSFISHLLSKWLDDARLCLPSWHPQTGWESDKQTIPMEYIRRMIQEPGSKDKWALAK